MNNLHIKKDDNVVVISGDSKGTIGKVIATSPEEGKVIVAGANIVSKHTKARKQGENSTIVKTEGAMYASKVQLVCPKCNKGVRTKVVFKTGKDGKNVKVRVCAKCGAEI
ncbi:MAG: 50S ribosomal protein L24 [Clostridia bacterium]|nr:50S ribosomal protein L24 [Clostridia bacterium]